MTTGTRYSIERSIIATYLYNSFSLDEEFERIINTLLDWKLFKSNITIKSCAKAIRLQQDKDIPFDEVTTVKFMEDKMLVDYNEMIKIQSSSLLSFKSLNYYLNLLSEEMNKEKKKMLLKGV